jgi:putative phosphoserine phosphatase/1-acylglycerol-3-phosphate O-acyltransferase
MKIALFDFDGTILEGNSWHLFFAQTVRQRPTLLAALLLRKLRLSSARQLKNAALRSLAGRSALEVQQFAESFHRRHLQPRLRPKALAQLAASRAEGCQLVLATGAFDFLVRPFARELAIPLVIATRLGFRGDTCLGDIDGPECRAQKKVEAVETAFAGQTIEWDRSYAFSDNDDDLPLLTKVGRGVWVNAPAVRQRDRPASISFQQW